MSNYALIVTEKGGTPKRLDFDKDEVTIGRVPGNDVILPKGNVSKRHSRVVRQDGRFFVVDLKSTNGTYLNGRRITTPSVIRPGDKIYVGDFIVVLDLGEGSAVDVPADAIEPPVFPAEPDNAEPPSAGGSPFEPDSSDVKGLPLDQEPLESAPPPSAAPGRPVGPPTLGGANPPLPAAPASALRQTIPQPMNIPQAPPQPIGGPPPSVPSQPGMPRVQPPGPGRLPTASPGATAPAMPPIGNPPLPKPPIPSTTVPSIPSNMPGAAPRPNTGMPPIGRPPTASGSPASIPAPPLPTAPARPPVRETPSSATAPPPASVAARPSQPNMYDPTADLDASDMQVSGNERTPPSARSIPQQPPAPAVPPATAAPVESAPAFRPTAPLINQPSLPPAPVAAAQPLSPPTTPPPAPDASMSAEAAPRDYASILAEFAAAARTAGANAPADRIADTATRARVRSAVEQTVSRKELPAGRSAEQIVRELTAELAGTGAIELALEDASINAVLIGPTGVVQVQRGTQVGPCPYVFSSPSAVVSALDRLLSTAGISRGNNTFIEADVADRLRVVAVLTPSVSIVVERGTARAGGLSSLVAAGVLPQPAATLLTHALQARRNILVSGPRGTGRTAMVAALLAEVRNERIVIIEDRREIALNFPESPAFDGNNDARRSLAFAMRMRPQRLAVGSVGEGIAGAFAGQFVTGAEGIVACIEGPSPSIALQQFARSAAKEGILLREEALARVAGSRPLIVQLARLGDGSLRVVSIGEARLTETGNPHVDELFALRIERAGRDRLETTLVATGLVPSFTENL